MRERGVFSGTWFVFITCIIVLIVQTAHAAEDTLVNLARATGVTYRYLDDNGNEIGGATYRDNNRTFLTDGEAVNDKTAATAYLNQNEKTMNVLFEFPIPVTPRKMIVTWMWGHNEVQWFDTLQVFVGADPKALTPLATYDHKERVALNSVNIAVPLEAASSRFVLVRIHQNADSKHFMFGIGEIQILGGANDLARLARPEERKLAWSVDRHTPCNLFGADEKVALTGKVISPVEGTCRLSHVLRNYFGEVVDRQHEVLDVKAMQERECAIAFSQLEPGYYELRSELEVVGADQRSYKTSGTTRFGIASFMKMTAEETLARGHRFGIQEGFCSDEGRDAFMKLGLNWFRGMICFGPYIESRESSNWSKVDEFVKTRMVDQPGIGLFEVKTFPPFAYDAERYGATKRHDWFVNTMPLKEPYQWFVHEQIRRLPANQKFFEIWNEPWDGYTEQEFATLAQWTLEAIKQVRPDAVVGPNLGHGAYVAKFIEAGGLKGMDMMTIHPYSSDFRSSPEHAQLREQVRGYHKLFKEALGKDLPLYVTEIGWPTPSQGQMVNSENRQAQYITRASLSLYAEDVKAIMPYCMGQPETSPAEKEDFFGFIRKNQEPKPVLLAYANVAQLINGSSFLGDVWIDTDVAGMLFRKGDQRILVVYTDNARRPVLIRPYASQVTLVDIMGRKRQMQIQQNRLSLTATDDPVFIMGVGPELEKQITAENRPVWSDVYKRGERTIRRLTLPHELQVSSETWRNVPAISIRDPHVPEADASATMKAAWDDQTLYFYFDVRDDDPWCNPETGVDLWRGDAIELFISAKPEASVAGFLRANDYQLLVAPTSKDGQPMAVLVDPYHRGQSIEGLRFKCIKTADGWAAEIAIPMQALGISPRAGTVLAMDAAIDDLDRKHPRIQINSNGRNDNSVNACIWSLLRLDD